jgi:large subunit ribosomal protein L30
MAEAKQTPSKPAGAKRASGTKAKQSATPAAPVAAKAPVPKAPKPAAPPKPPKAAKMPKAVRPAASGKMVKVQLVRSGIGTPKDQRATLKGLGLTRINQVRELKESDALRGMLNKVRHLISVDGAPAA